MRPADSPAFRPLRPGRGKCVSAAQTRLRIRSCTSLAISGTRPARSVPFLANASRRSSSFVDAALDDAPARAQLALDAHARFADLALEAVARGHAAALEAPQLGLGLGGRGVGGDRVGHAGDDAVAGEQGGAHGDQHGALGVVADHGGAVVAARARRASPGALGGGRFAARAALRAVVLRPLALLALVLRALAVRFARRLWLAGLLVFEGAAGIWWLLVVPQGLGGAGDSLN